MNGDWTGLCCACLATFGFSAVIADGYVLSAILEFFDVLDVLDMLNVLVVLVVEMQLYPTDCPEDT